MMTQTDYYVNRVPTAPAYGAHPYEVATGYRAERTLLAERGVVVSSARFVVFNATYPLAGITAVWSFMRPADRSGGIWAIVIGVVLLLLSGLSAVFAAGGVLMIAIGIFICAMARPFFGVRIATAGGQVDTLCLQDRDFIARVTAALNQSIIQRG